MKMKIGCPESNLNIGFFKNLREALASFLLHKLDMKIMTILKISRDRFIFIKKIFFKNTLKFKKIKNYKG
jgi:hypothetical protein